MINTSFDKEIKIPSLKNRGEKSTPEIISDRETEKFRETTERLKRLKRLLDEMHNIQNGTGK